MINPIVKKYFTKFGFSDRVLQVLSDSVTGSLANSENATEEEINESCKNFDGLASSFQSEIESRVALDRKKADRKKGEEEPKKDDEEKSKIDPTLQAVLDRLDRMEKGQISGDLNKSAAEKLKANHANLTDSQIASILHGRNFESEDQLNDFIEAQKGFQESITQEVVERKAGMGYQPAGSKGEASKLSIENDIKNFNQKY